VQVLGSIADTQICSRLMHVRSIATEVRSFAQAYCGLSEVHVCTQQRTRRVQVREQAGIDSSALDRNRGAIDRTITN
jgi:hypothetical protein